MGYLDRLSGTATRVAIAMCLVASSSSAWQVEIDSEYGESRDDEARAVVVDSRGDVVASGHADGDDWIVAKLAGGTGAELWRAIVSGGDTHQELGNAVAVDSSDDVIVAGGLNGSGGFYDADLAVAKLRGTTGAELWRYTLNGSEVDSRDAAYDVAVDANGDVVVIGVVQEAGTDRDVAVAKISGADGSELWKRVLRGTDTDGWDYGFGVAVAANGDVVAACRIANETTNTDAVVARLAAADGTTVWRTEIARSGFEYAQEVVVDASGDVFFGGRLDDGVSGDFAVIKLAGADGSVLWENDLCCSSDGGRVEALALAPNGDIVAAGWAGRQDYHAAFNVAAFESSTGSLEWRIIVPGAHGYGTAFGVGVDRFGDVLAAGMIETTSEGHTDAYLIKIHPCHFDEENCEEPAPSFGAKLVWKKKYNGKADPDDDYDQFYDMALDADGQVAAAGTIWNRNPIYPEESHSDLFVSMRSEDGSSVYGPDPFQPACADGIDNDGDGAIDFGEDAGCESGDDLFEQATPDVPLMCTGRKMQFKDRASKSRKRGLALKSDDPQLSPPASGSAADPRLAGAVIEVRNPHTGERAYAALPAAGWQAKGSGYRFRGRGAELGPCKSVVFDVGRLKIRCKGLGLRYSLDEPSQGALAVRLHFASGERICTEFGGSVSHDQSTQGQRRTVKFRASDAAAPAACSMD